MNTAATVKNLASHPAIVRVVEHARMPLYRNGYALVFSSAATSALGVIYWVLAARSYSTATVGLNSAAISTMIFLANLAQMNLGNALIRFIPNAGLSTRRLILATYAVGLMGGLFISGIFLLGYKIFTPGLSTYFTDPITNGWFVLSTMCWSIFVLQDSALTGLRQATWVPAENIIYALLKMALLVIMAILLPSYGLFVSWTLPVLLLMFPVNWLIFRRLIPRHLAENAGRASSISVKVILRYVAGDYFSSLIWTATASLIPVLVIERLGAEANAYFYLPWTIAYALYLVSRNMGMSFIAESANDESKLNLYAQRTFRQTIRIVGLIVLGIVITAPLILTLFGKNYAAEGVQLMQLLVLSALPYVVVSQYISLARVKRNIRALVVVQMALCTIVLVLSVVLMTPMGITGVGVAWLAGQGLVALALLFTSMRTLWMAQLNTYPLVSVLNGPRRLFGRFVRARHTKALNAILPEILPTVPASPANPSSATWQVRGVLSSVTDVQVALLGSAGADAVALLKVATTDNATKSLRHRMLVADCLWQDPRLAGWRSVLPEVLAHGQAGGHDYVIEQKLPGVELRKLAGKPAFASGQAAAVCSITQMHHLIGNARRVDDAMMMRWIHQPVRLLRAFSQAHLKGGSYNRSIDRMCQSLHDALAGRDLWVSRIHGDFAPGNILVTPDGQIVTGLVDWEMSVEDSLPQLDVVQLLISSRVLERRREMGDVVIGLLGKEDLTPLEQSLLEYSDKMLGNENTCVREYLLLCWLQQVADTLQKSNRYTTSWVWSVKNIEQVLLQL